MPAAYIARMPLGKNIAPGTKGQYVPKMGQPVPFKVVEPKYKYKDERWLIKQGQRRPDTRPAYGSRAF